MFMILLHIFLGNFLWVECELKLDKRDFKRLNIKSQIAGIFCCSLTMFPFWNRMNKNMIIQSPPQ